MTFICALIPLSCVSVALSFGGATSPLVLLQTIVYLPLFGKIGQLGKIRILLIPICTASVIMRFLSLCALSKGSLGLYGGVALALICVAVSGWSAYNGGSAFHSAVPVFFISAFLALYVTAVSFSEPLREPFDSPSLAECAAAVLCPLSACLSFSHLTTYPPMKRYIGALMGVAVCSIFLIFQSADAEFGFISVPLAVVMSSLEIKAAVSVIRKRKTE